MAPWRISAVIGAFAVVAGVPLLALGQEGDVGVDSRVRKKKFTNLPEVNEVNQLWNESGTELNRAGGYRDGRNQKVMDLSTPDGATREYKGVTLGVTKREGQFRVRGTYTLSALTGTVWADLNNPWAMSRPATRTSTATCRTTTGTRSS